MAMTKAEKARVEELETALALCWPSYPMPQPMSHDEITAAKVKIEAGSGPMDRWRTHVAKGWFYNAYNGSMSQGWSDGMYHSSHGGNSASQGMGRMYRARSEAAKALRIEMSRDYAKKLAAIDRIIADAIAIEAAEAGEMPKSGSTRSAKAREGDLRRVPVSEARKRDAEMMRSLDEITRLIEVYPERWRRWCDGPENGGCACMGCARVPAPTTVRGDPEGQPFPNPADALTKEEVELYLR